MSPSAHRRWRWAGARSGVARSAGRGFSRGTALEHQRASRPNPLPNPRSAPQPACSMRALRSARGMPRKPRTLAPVGEGETQRATAGRMTAFSALRIPMRLSRFHLSTSKETPADAEIVSHQLMLRAGLIRKLAAGIYTWTPLGLRVLRRVETVVREEMNAAGALEVLMPAV